MADGEVRAQDLAQETASTLSGNEQFVMFDSTAGKRADIDDVAAYVAGDKTTLKTTNKTSPVAAINENFDAIADVKEDLSEVQEPFILCLAETSDFDFTTDKYYNNSATPISADVGSNYHIAQPFSASKGTYTLCEIVPFFSSYKVGSTFTRVGSGTSRTTVTITLSADAELYLTTRTSNTSLQIGAVEGVTVPSILKKGVIDFEINGVKYTDLVSKNDDSIQKTKVIHRCYANAGSFDFTTDKYYNSSGTAIDAYSGSNYHIAPSFTVAAGTFSFTGVIPSLSFYKLNSASSGTALGASTVLDEGIITITINEPATIYLTTRTTDLSLKILAVDGIFMPNESVDVGLFDVAVGDVSLYDLSEKSATTIYYEKADYTSLSLYESVAVIGDSYSCGALYGIEGITQGRHNNIAWLIILGRRCGFIPTLYATPAYNTYDFLNDTTSDYGLGAMLADTAKQLYFIMLGINGDEDDTIGTIADCKVDWTQNGNSFYGRYGKVIGNIKTHAPKAKIVCIVPPQGTTRFQAIMDVADFYEVPYMKSLDDPLFASDFYKNNLSVGHPIAVVYSGMASAYERLYAHCVIENAEYFENYEGN